MTKEEIKNKITEHKECCKKLAEEYRQRYNEDKTDKLVLNMFYHNVIAYNNFENILAMIEDRNSMMLCFAEPPILTEKTVEVDINRIADLEKENAELKEKLDNLANVAEVRLANWQKLDKELKAEKEYSATLRKEIDEYINSHTLCVKYKELEKAYNEVEELLDKQIEATYKLFEENKELKEKLTYAKTIIQDLLDNTDEYARQRAEDFLKENN